MVGYYLLLCLLGILTCFLASTVAREAIVGRQAMPVSRADESITVSVQWPLRDGTHAHRCGGCIIANRFVLTAAHCVLTKNRTLHSPHVSILARTTSIHKTDPPAVRVRVEKIFFPREFHPNIEFSYGDIAVLRLVHSLELGHSSYAMHILLPRSYYIPPSATFQGFGSNVHNGRGDGSTDGQLRQAFISTLPDEYCEEKYPPGAFESSRHLCATTYYQLDHFQNSVCTGDDGGPLVQNIGNTENFTGVVYGILSRISPDQYQVPPIYTRVIHYLGMILSVMHHGHDSQMISLPVN